MAIGTLKERYAKTLAALRAIFTVALPPVEPAVVAVPPATPAPTCCANCGDAIADAIVVRQGPFMRDFRRSHEDLADVAFGQGPAALCVVCWLGLGLFTAPRRVAA
jgi:hypothetical protein